MKLILFVNTNWGTYILPVFQRVIGKTRHEFGFHALGHTPTITKVFALHQFRLATSSAKTEAPIHTVKLGSVFVP